MAGPGRWSYTSGAVTFFVLSLVFAQEPNSPFLSPRFPLPDNSATLLLRTARLPTQGGSLLVPLELVDGGSPTRTGSPTLTVSICRCRRDGALHSCGPEALGSPAGLSTGALLAILACVGTLLGEKGQGRV